MNIFLINKLAIGSVKEHFNVVANNKMIVKT
jgi:hypothetical protein